MTETIGCAIAVHRALGPGFLERSYRRAMYIELEARHLAYQAEQPIKVVYRDIEIPGGLRAGLLMNVRAPSLRQGLRRIVL